MNNIKSWPTIFSAAFALFLSNTIIFSYGFFQREQRLFLGEKSNSSRYPFIPETNINQKNCLLHNDIFTALDNCKIEKYSEENKIYFVGDKCEGYGNDRALYEALVPEVTSFKTENPKNTAEIIEKIIGSI